MRMRLLTTLIGGLLGLFLAGLAAVALIVAFVVVLMAGLAAIAAVATAIVAYFKREKWTLPAYRWTRDRTGRWSVTPWSGGDAGEAGDMPPVEEAP
jgi:hypothetical protein